MKQGHRSLSNKPSHRLTALLLTVGLLAGMHSVPVSATGGAEDPYIQDGLVLHLDALDNTGTGSHSSDTSEWVNLANSDESVDVEGHAWGEDYLDLKGYIKLPDTVRQAITGEEFTVEFLIDGFDASADSSAIRNLMALTGDDQWIASTTEKGSTPNDSFVIFMNQAGGGNSGKFCFRTCIVNGTSYTKINSTGPDYAKVDAADMNQVTNTITFKSGGSSVWYLDGQMASEAVNTSATVSADGFFIGGAYQTERQPQVILGAATDTVSNRAFAARIKAVRIYNRELTAAEAAQNAAADQARYYPLPQYDTDGYIQNGMILRLDGIRNTPDGHDADAGVWTNLADPGQSIQLNGNTWNADGQSLSIGAGDGKDYIILPDSVREAIASGQFTIEFLLDNYSGSTASQIANIMALTGSDQWIEKTTAPGGTPNDNFVIYQNENGGATLFKINSGIDSAATRAAVSASSIDGATNALTFQTGSKTNWWQNGTLSSSSGITYTSAPAVATYAGAGADEVPQVIFGAATDTVSNRIFSGNVKAIRVYNRVLSDDEIQHNAEVDASRFPSPSDYDRLAQESWDNVIGNTGALGSVTLDALQSYATSQLAGAEQGLTVTVEPGSREGAYIFRYQAAGSLIDSHTLYVDCPYTMDGTALTETEKTALLNDVVQFQGGANNKISVSWDEDEQALQYSGTDPRPRPVTHMYLPVYFSGDAYVYEATVGFDNYGSWSTLCFAAEDFENHYQYAFWGNVTGTAAEFCRAQTSVNDSAIAVGHDNIPLSTFEGFLGSGEGKIDRSLYSKVDSAYQVVDTVDYKVVVYQGVLYGFIDGVQVLTTVSTGNIYKDFNGAFGFNTSSSTLDIHRVSIRPITEANKATELAGIKLAFNPANSYKTDLYEPDTDVRAAPIIMQRATAATADVSGEGRRPSALIFDVRLEDGTLSAYDSETRLGAFSELYAVNQPKTNVGARLALGDKETANALAAFVRDNSAGNLWVISNDVELLEIITAEAGTVRGVVDFTGDALRAPGNISYDFGDDYAAAAVQNFEYVTYSKTYDELTVQERYDALFSRGYRTALLPESAVTKDHIHYLQGNLIYVIAETDADDEAAFYDLITAGVNGILSSNYTANLNVLEGGLFDVGGGNVLVRGGHVVGHRGDMGNPHLYPENSVESIVASAQGGSSSVEFDMYMTLDKKLILMHNNNISGYFEYDDDAPLSAEERAANNAKTITQRSWKGDLEYLHSTYNKDIRMQQLYQLYEAIDTEYPELRLHHEIKDGRTETLNRTIALMDECGLRDRSDMMCFTKSVVQYVTSMGISAQYLATVSSYNDTDRIFSTEIEYRPLNSTWHATWSSMNQEFLEELKHFGQTAYPWPTSQEALMDAYYVQGYQGFTTDIPHWTDDYIKEIVPSVDPSTGTVTATAYTLAHHRAGVFDEGSTTVQPWWIDQNIAGPSEYDLSGFELVAVAGNPVIDNTNLTAFGGSGDLVAIRYQQKLTGSSSYYIYSESFAPAKKQTASVQIADEPAKVSYSRGESLDVTGGTIQVTYNDGSSEIISMTSDMVTGFNSGTTGRQKLTVTWNGHTTFYYVAVSNPSISGGSGSSSYRITVSAGNGGTAAASASSARAGSSVALTVKADAGYEIESVVITGSAGRLIPYTEKDGVYTFIMPSSSVNVAAAFRKTGSSHENCPSAKFIDVTSGSWYHEAVDYAVENDLMHGVSDTSFAPDGTLNRAMLAAILYRLEGGPAVSAENPFLDVTGSAWYADAVIWASENGIVSGFGDSTFRPMANITREQMAVMLHRYADYKGLDTTEGASLDAYSDAGAISNWALESMQWANAEGLITGRTDTTVVPSGNTTRAEATVILMRFAEFIR